MTRLRTKYIGGLALAVASVTALAACSSSSSSSSGSATNTTTTPGAVSQPGSITYALAPGAVPNWILPMPTSSTNSVYNVFNFEWQSWPPMYYAPSGSTPTVDPTLSVANPPVWSNGDKTFSITLKSWKWNNGQTISSKDVQFTFDMIKAAVKASPANWAAYVPGYFPDIITSTSTPDASTIVVNLSKAVNPTWLEYDILGGVPIMPASAWSKDSASGPTLDYTNPANAAKIFAFLTAASKSVSTYATNPLWQTVYGPYKISSFNDTTGAIKMVPNNTYSGPHANPKSTDPVSTAFHSAASEVNGTPT